MIQAGDIYRYKSGLTYPGFIVGDKVHVEKVENGYVEFKALKENEIQNAYTMEILKFLKSFDFDMVTQVKPAHYDTAIDPIAFAKANFSREAVAGFMRINAIKYLQRYDSKDGVKDLKKARHYLDMLIEMEEEGE